MMVFAASFSTLFFEVLLSRSFALTQWSHLSFLVISTALFGYSAGAMAVHFQVSNLYPRGKETSPLFCLLTGCGVIVSWTLVNLLPFDSIQLPFLRIQFFYLVCLFMLLSIPFFFAGIVTTRAFAARPEKAGLIYAASMTGSAAGAVLPALALPALGFGGAVALAAAVPAVPTLFQGNRRHRIGSAVLILGCAGAFFTPGLTSPRPSSYKELPKYLQYPEAVLVRTVERFRGTLDVLTGGGLHTAPGLSLGFRGETAMQTALFIDNGSSVHLFHESLADNFAFSRASTGWLPYIMSPDPEQVLVVLENGGAAIPAAIASGAKMIHIFDGISARADEIADHYGGDIHVFTGPIRSLIHRAGSEYDVVALDHPGTPNPGLAGINEDYLLTREAVSEM
ncbi:MAG: hypothetical protein HN368_20085, partial [Spirochaetales bacterium]|nr:hypothetical protein [Spirochaetales bacterium]